MKKFALVLCAALLIIAAIWSTAQTKSLERSPYGAERELSEISMTVREGTVGPQAETVTLVIKNLSGKRFDYGAPYEIEKLKGGVWYSYPPEEDMAFIMILYMIEPNGTVEEAISLYSFYGALEPGTYRVVKSFNAEDGTQGVAFAVFAIK